MHSRHDLIVTLANLSLDEMTDEEIVRMCPTDYGGEVTEDHLNYLWDMLYTDYERMSDDELYSLWERVKEAKDREIMQRWMDGESDEEPNIVSNPSRTLH